MRFNKNLLDKIKLVIWDLDETFWQGTLSESTHDSPVIPSQRNIECVKGLTHRGIISAVCSKNDKAEAEKKLAELDVLDYFVFNSIKWEPKGQRIRKLIQDMGLRDVNVLFIDDNIQNLNEAEYYSPGIMTALPDVIDLLYESIETIGKDDSALSRLKQYKVLQLKKDESKSFSSNEEFLAASDIRVTFQYGSEIDVDRVHEMILRTNQLNFTNLRISREELQQLIDDSAIETATVSVRDKYGKYGIVGFYVLKDGRLIHFLFSCRTMGMGIEQFVYAHLNYPLLEIVEPVSSNISKADPKPQYIKIDTCCSNNTTASGKESAGPKILLKGPCDLSVMASYIEDSAGIMESEFNFIDANGNQADFYNHSITILDSADDVHLSFPFASEEVYATKIFSGDYDVVCLSPLMDATVGVYRHNDSGRLFAFGLYTKSMCESKNWPEYIAKSVMTARCNFTQEMLADFSKSYTKITWTADDIAENYLKIIRKIKGAKPSTRICILLLPELPFEGHSCLPSDKYKFHKEINRALIDRLANEDVHYIDVNNHIKSQSDYFDSINHYSKIVYYNLAKDFIEIIGRKVKTRSIFRVYFDHIKRTVYKHLVLKVKARNTDENA